LTDSQLSFESGGPLAHRDPERTLMTVPPGEPLRRKPDYPVPYYPPTKDRAAVARPAILGWGGAEGARPTGRAQTRRDLCRRHCLQPADGARRGRHARPAEDLPGY